MRVERLFEILTILLSKGIVSAKDLAQHFQVSTRTIYRDIDILSVSGIPVCMKKGRGGGISLIEGYKLDKTLLSEKDVESIIMSVGTLGMTKYNGIQPVLEKLLSLFQHKTVEDWVEIDFTNWDTDNEKDTRIDDVRKAILNRQFIELDYYNSNGQKTHRIVAPLKLVFKSYSWYVNAFCISKNAIRLFKITRIKNLLIQDKTFEREKYSPLVKKSNIEYPQYGNIEVVLRFSKDIVYLLFDYYDENDVEHQQDGSCIVKAVLPQGDWFFSHILSYGDKVEILSPLCIREEFKKRLKKVNDIYN